MSDIDNGGPAFPLTEEAVNHRNKDFDMQGMTLRDYFAAKILAAITLNEGVNQKPESCDIDAKISYMYADAMIRARKANP